MQNENAKTETAKTETAIDNSATKTAEQLAADKKAQLEAKAQGAKEKRKTSKQKAKEEQEEGVKYGLFCLTNANNPKPEQRRSYWLAGMIVSGILTATGQPTKNGGNKAKFIAICKPAKSAINDGHPEKYSATDDKGNIRFTDKAYCDTTFKKNIADYREVIDQYIELINTGKVGDKIKPDNKGTKPAVRKV